jgi:hypothetical protein
VEFPPLTSEEIEEGLLSLVCSSCKSIDKVDNNSVEADLCAVNNSVLRFCKHCGFSTLWKPATGVAAPDLVSSAATQKSASLSEPPRSPTSYSSPMSTPAKFSLLAPATSKPTVYEEPRAAVLTLPPPAAREMEMPRVDRRKHPRAKVNYSALVRHPERGDDIVVCEDMSRGGLRFKSKKTYYERSLVEIAVPYVVGQTPIFVPAQIVSATEIPEQKTFRYGVAYLQQPKPNNHF